MLELKFTYEVQGNTYSRYQYVPRGTYNTVYPGDAVVVLYDSQNPQKALLKDVSSEYVEVYPLTTLYLLYVVFAGFIICFFIVFALTTLISRFFPAQ